MNELTDVLLKAAETLEEKNTENQYLEYGRKCLVDMEKKVLGGHETGTDVQKLLVTVKKFVFSRNRKG